METVPFPGQPQKWLSTSLGHEEMHQGRPSSLHLHSNSLLNTAQATCSDKVSFKKLLNYKGPSFEYFVIFTLRSKQIEKATNPWPDYITAGRFTEEIRRVTWPLPFLWVKNFIPAGRIRPPHPHICMSGRRVWCNLAGACKVGRVTVTRSRCGIQDRRPIGCFACCWALG